MRLDVENLACVRGGRMIFSDIGFGVEAGECLILLGPNGAGKTSLLRVLAGYIRSHSGTIAVEGGDPELTLGEMSHYVGHLNGVKSHFTVRENLKFWADYLNSGADLDGLDARVEAALAAFALKDLYDVPAGYLSAGQKRRLGLARLLVAERPVWFLDEPTVSLDAASQACVAKAVNAHLAKGGLAIAATHIDLGIENAREFHLDERRVKA